MPILPAKQGLLRGANEPFAQVRRLLKLFITWVASAGSPLANELGKAGHVEP